MKRLLLMVLVWGMTMGTATASAQTWSNIRDAVPGKYFDAATTTADGATLTIGLAAGFDPATFVSNEFRASTLAYQNRQATDTISFMVTAPPGFYISGITYQQSGTYSTARGAVQRSSTQWTINGFPANIADFHIVTGHADLAVPVAEVAITTSLFVGPLGDISITGGTVTVTLAPYPDVEGNGSVVSILD